MTRQLSRPIAGLLAALAVIPVACGDDDEPATPDAVTSSASGGTGGTGATSDGTVPDTGGTSGTGGTHGTGGTGDATGTAPAAGTSRTVDSPNGPIVVPVDPERVVALDEYAGMNLLALGVVPSVVYGAYQSEVGQQVLAAAGAEIRAMDGFGTPNVEDVAATRPEVIVFTTEGAYADVYPQLSAIAPTLELPYSVPWREAIEATAEAVGRPDEAAHLISVLEARIAELAAEVAAAPTSISILGDTQGMVFAASTTSPLAHVIDEAGFTRPTAQAEGAADPVFDSAIMISTEVLSEHDADVIAVLSGAFYEPRTFLDAPTFQALPAVRDGRSVVVDGDLWFGSFPFALFWLLEDLTAIHDGLDRDSLDQDDIGDADDVDARWAAFEALVQGA